MTLQLNAFILLDGNSQDAITFYEQALGEEVLFKQSVGEGPAGADSSMPEALKILIAHCVLKVGESQIMVSDTEPGQSFQKGDQVNICITADGKEKAAQIYEALVQGGEVMQPLQEAYFSPAYGMITDKFGVCFQIFTKRPR